LILVHFDRFSATWTAYQYNTDRGDYDRIQSSDLQHVEIGNLNGLDTGFSGYLANLQGKNGKNKTIQGHRRAHKLFQD
jgi:hypothetical protein